MSKKSKTCFGTVSGKPLTEYPSKQAAEEGAAHAAKAYGLPEQMAYECDKCGKWHTAPKDRHTPSTTCTKCRGKDGTLKELYRSREEAKRRAGLMPIKLKVYKCPVSKGWHLSSSKKH